MMKFSMIMVEAVTAWVPIKTKITLCFISQSVKTYYLLWYNPWFFFVIKLVIKLKTLIYESGILTIYDLFL